VNTDSIGPTRRGVNSPDSAARARPRSTTLARFSSSRCRVAVPGVYQRRHSRDGSLTGQPRPDWRERMTGSRASRTATCVNSAIRGRVGRSIVRWPGERSVRTFGDHHLDGRGDEAQSARSEEQSIQKALIQTSLQGGKRADGAGKGRQTPVIPGQLRSITVTRKPPLSWPHSR
jgi:hypothetical protein